jgi:hypothetical protein
MIGGGTLNDLFDLLGPSRFRARGHAPGLGQRLRVVAALAEREIRTGPPIPMGWRERLGLWRHGFTSRSGVLFGVEEGEYDQFVSDLQLELMGGLGDEWDDVVDNKLTWYLLFGSFDEHLPALYGVLDGGELRRRLPFVSDPLGAPRPSEPADAIEWIGDYLGENDALVLKPVYGTTGTGVLVCRSAEAGGYRVNGESKTAREFADLVADLEEYLAWAFVEQADYAERLFPDSANTLRLLTLWDYETDEPFLSGTVQRIGTSESAPVDNWGRGGLSADVDEDGTLSSGARWSSGESELDWHETHPDTGARIEGTRVPNWSAVRERVLEMAAAFPHLPRIGWDVVVTDDGGFVILEINAHAGVETLQVHRPLLRDPRIRRFYEHHGRA